MTTDNLIIELKKIDLENIYIENVRSILNVSNRFAKFICETAVRLNYLERKINICCPNHNCGRILASYKNINSIEDEFNCFNCEILETDQFNFKIKDCQQITTYKYIS